MQVLCVGVSGSMLHDHEQYSGTAVTAYVGSHIPLTHTTLTLSLFP